MFQIQRVNNKEEWERFVRSQPFTLFVQSWQYGEFYCAMGEAFWIFGIYNDSALVGGALVVSTHAKRGNFLYAPYGPILPEQGRGEALRAFTDALVAFGREQAYHFLKISPFWDDTLEWRRLTAGCGWRKAPLHTLAETTWILDIRPPEDRLFSQMEKNHRNLIRRCEQSGVSIVMDTDEVGVQELIVML